MQTCIQSGNVVFEAAKLASTTISNKLADRILKDYGFPVDVISRTRDEMGKIIQNNPWLKERGIDPAKLHVAFLSDTPAAEAVTKLASLTIKPDKVRVAGREIYFYFPNGVSGSSVWKHPLDRVLAVPVTMRNWNTVNSLYKMAVECG